MNQPKIKNISVVKVLDWITENEWQWKTKCFFTDNLKDNEAFSLQKENFIISFEILRVPFVSFRILNNSSFTPLNYSVNNCLIQITKCR